MTLGTTHRALLDDAFEEADRFSKDMRVRRSGQSIEDAAFFSGAALAKLNETLAQDALPLGVLRDRLALRAAEATVVVTGRLERATELRDAVMFLRPEDHPGPAGATYMSWRRAVARPLSKVSLQRAFPQYEADEIEGWLRVPSERTAKSPIGQAAATLAAVLKDQPKSEGLAMCLADARLARAMNWTHVVPLMALGLTARDLRKTEDDARLACHTATTFGAEHAVSVSQSLIRRAEALRAVAPKLRAKGADKAVALFLAQDAVTPAMLTHLMSDRAARRFCDRLVSLGVAQELSGRESFRLYGI
ncbi:DUF1403 family protein [Shimia sp. MMG029]|uniref:DUF1403 family protein n=1 Tax=Shimia sp. MMG029 TaxID=3021978 RepID=UPI0022FF0F18|nr:DUF1403 family protein [Shimia sp. MMG029]MDA5558977.1 DUF1403 family protein [Shimia sp. MMG029]